MGLGLLFAMPSELEGLLAAYGHPAPREISGLPFYSLAPGVTACLSGVGKVNAAMAAALLCRECAPARILNAGVAGCFTQLPAGTLVVADRSVQHDMDASLAGDPVGQVPTVGLREFPAHDPQGLCACLRTGGFSPVLGTVATGDWFGRDLARATHIRQAFDALVCDMEGCAVAQVGLRCGVPVSILKVVSDHLFSPSQGQEYAAGVSPAARALTAALLHLIPALTQ